MTTEIVIVAGFAWLIARRWLRKRRRTTMGVCRDCGCDVSASDIRYCEPCLRHRLRRAGVHERLVDLDRENSP